jgi:hypothetical protein
LIDMDIEVVLQFDWIVINNSFPSINL